MTRNSTNRACKRTVFNKIKDINFKFKKVNKEEIIKKIKKHYEDCSKFIDQYRK